MNTTPIISHSLRYQSANKTLHEYIEADVSFHGLNSDHVFEQIAGLSERQVERLRSGQDAWAVSRLMKVAEHLRSTDTASLILGWSLTFMESARV